MNRLRELSELLVASWAIAAGDEERRIPTSHGLLDRALQIAEERNAFPEWVWKELHFVDSRVGLQCVELPMVLDWAQRAGLTASPNPSYATTEIQVSAGAAKHLLKRLKVAEEEARLWGSALKVAIDDAKIELESFDESRAAATYS